MDFINHLKRQVELARADNEFRAASAGLTCGLSLEITGDHPSTTIIVIGIEPSPIVTLQAGASVWRQIASAKPPAGFHSFTASTRQYADFHVQGSPLQVAQLLHAIERLFEILRGQIIDKIPKPYPDLRSLKGGYANLALPDGRAAQVYYDHSGNPDAPPLLMLHTAGADARQFHPLMASPELQQSWNMIAFDMPAHGRSMPIANELWQGYRLTKQHYIDICQAFVQQVIGKPTVLLGCSMGAAMALKVAAVCPQWVAGVIALEAPFHASGRRTNLLANPQVNQAAHNPSYVRGLMSPSSPLSGRRAAAWIYSQGGFQIYSGDLVFYSDEFNAETDLQGLDATNKGIVLLTGSYDYSATPADSRKVADLIPGARFILMPDLGHFPMVENPERLIGYLKPELDFIRSKLKKHS